MALASLVDRFDDLVLGAKAIPLTDEVRVERDEALQLLGWMQSEAPPEARRVVDRLDTLVRDARTVPLTDQLRLPREGVYELLDEIRAALSPERTAAFAEVAGAGTTELVARLESTIRDARGLPFLKSRVRLPRETVNDLLDAIRLRVFADAKPGAPSQALVAALDRVDDAIHGAPVVPGSSGQVHLKRDELLALVAELKARLGEAPGYARAVALGQRDRLLRRAEQRRVDELAALERSDRARLERLDGRPRDLDLRLGREVGLLDRPPAARVDRGAAEVAELAAAAARAGEARRRRGGAGRPTAAGAAGRPRRRR